MIVLGIESTCDETAAALIDGEGNLLSNVVYSQVPLHCKYNGVVPELASRAHCEKIASILHEALSPLKGRKPDAVAFANGPGLPGALVVGKTAAETLGALLGVPVIGVNHLEGHIFACELAAEGGLRPLEFPLIALTVSGGHTELWLVKDYGSYRVLGRTRDDAAGEAFDKVAKLLGLGYPGGPVVDKLAKSGDKNAIKFTRPMLRGTWEFSFSGLKTAVSYTLRDNPSFKPEDMCASFQAAVVDTLVEKTLAAARKFGVKHIAVGGGVAANGALRETMKAAAQAEGMEARFVERKHCTDNGAMIALAALRKISKCGLTGGKYPINPELRVKNWVC